MQEQSILAKYLDVFNFGLNIFGLPVTGISTVHASLISSFSFVVRGLIINLIGSPFSSNKDLVGAKN